MEVCFVWKRITRAGRGEAHVVTATTTYVEWMGGQGKYYGQSLIGSTSIPNQDEDVVVKSKFIEVCGTLALCVKSLYHCLTVKRLRRCMRGWLLVPPSFIIICRVCYFMQMSDGLSR